MAKSPSLFRTPEGEAAVQAAYVEALQAWPVAYTEETVSTRWGSTCVFSCGNADAPPLVLLHGMSVSSPSWYPNVESIGSIRHVYAFDYPGDLGGSDYRNPPASAKEAAEWFAEVCDGLGIVRTDVAGKSFGGFLAANAALHVPDRVDRVVLISPAAVFSRLRLAFYVRTMLAMLVPTALTRNAAIKWLHAPGGYRRNPFTRLFSAAITHGRPQLRFAPAVFNADELRRLTQPVLYLVGEHEVIVNRNDSTRRAARLVPDIRVEVVPGAGHGLAVEQAESTNRLITDFLTG